MQIVKNSDLIVTVDSAPLHLAFLYNKKIISFFSSSIPIRVIKNNSKIKVIRHHYLHNIMCEKKDCRKSTCLDFIMDKNIFEHSYKLDNEVIIEKNICYLKNKENT